MKASDSNSTTAHRKGRHRRNVELPLRLHDNWLRSKLFSSRAVRTVILSYFVTFRCNLRCSFWEYTDPVFRTSYPELPTERALRLVEIARRGVPSLAISGGEPLLMAALKEVILETHGPDVHCARQCFLPCYLEASTAYSHMLSTAMQLGIFSRR